MHAARIKSGAQSASLTPHQTPPPHLHSQHPPTILSTTNSNPLILYIAMSFYTTPTDYTYTSAFNADYQAPKNTNATTAQQEDSQIWHSPTVSPLSFTTLLYDQER